MMKTGSQAVRRALSLLSCFTTEKPLLTLTEISEMTGLTYPTASRMVSALVDKGFLNHDSMSSTYSPGPEIMRLARIILEGSDGSEVLSIALPHLEYLRTVTGETVGFHVPIGLQRICVSELTSRHPVRMGTGVGVTYPLYAGAAGKAMLAWLSEAQIDQCLVDHALKPLTENTLTSSEKLLAELENIRQVGYATSFGETVLDASALAAPILGSDSRTKAAINITGPASRWNWPKMQEALPKLLAVSRQLSAQLGYSKKTG